MCQTLWKRRILCTVLFYSKHSQTPLQPFTHYRVPHFKLSTYGLFAAYVHFTSKKTNNIRYKWNAPNFFNIICFFGSEVNVCSEETVVGEFEVRYPIKYYSITLESRLASSPMKACCTSSYRHNILLSARVHVLLISVKAENMHVRPQYNNDFQDTPSYFIYGTKSGLAYCIGEGLCTLDTCTWLSQSIK